MPVASDWATLLSLFTFMHWRRKRQPTPVFLPGESQGRGSLVGCRLWGRTESDATRLKRLSSSSSSILLNDCKISYQCSQDIYTILTPIAQRKQRILDCTLHFLPFYFWIDLYMHASFFLLLLLVHEVLFCIRKWFHPCSGPHHLQSLTQTVNPGPLGTTSILFPLALALSL